MRTSLECNLFDELKLQISFDVDKSCQGGQCSVQPGTIRGWAWARGLTMDQSEASIVSWRPISVEHSDNSRPAHPVAPGVRSEVSGGEKRRRSLEPPVQIRQGQRPELGITHKRTGKTWIVIFTPSESDRFSLASFLSTVFW